MTTPPTPVYLTEAHRKAGQRRLVYKARGYDYFAHEIRAAVRGYCSGALDDMSFYDAMYSTLRQGITAAWHEGAELCGIYPDELTIDERKRLQFRIVEQMTYVTGFADAIREGSKAARESSPRCCNGQGCGSTATTTSGTKRKCWRAKTRS